MMKRFGIYAALALMMAPFAVSAYPAQTQVGWERLPGVAGCPSSALQPCFVPWDAGATPFLNTSVSNTAIAVDANGGVLYSLVVYNPNASVEWVQLFNAATANVTVGTTTPVASYPVAASGSTVVLINDIGIGFSAAISIATTTTATGGTAPGSALTVNASYK